MNGVKEKRLQWEKDRQAILSVMRSDPHLTDVYGEDGKKFPFLEADIHPLRYGEELFAIIKERKESSFNEALVWRVVICEDGSHRLAWIENEWLESALINWYVRRKKKWLR